MDKKKVKILAVDDNPDNLIVLNALVSESFPDAEFITAGSGNEGLNKCRRIKPDVMLLDLIMPDIDGYEVCRRLKSDEDYRSIPVIILTANNVAADGRIKALETGADAFLSKPVDDAELKAQIKAMLRIKEADDLKNQYRKELEKMVKERTTALETELADRKKAEKKLIHSLDKLTRNRLAILNLMEDLKQEMNERKKFENDLKEERNLLRTLIDNLPDIIYIMDKEGRKVIANRADVRNIGFEDEKEVLGKNDIDLFAGEIGQRGHNDNMSVIKTATPIIDREEHFYTNEGKIVWILTSKFPLYDSQNNIIGLLGTGHDITERRRMQLKLIESEAYHRTLIDISPDGIITSDLEGKITYGSIKTFEIFNYPPAKSPIGTSILELVMPEYRDKLIERFTDIISGNMAPETKEYYLKTFNGIPFWAELSSSPLTDNDGQPSGILIVCRDISERKRYEAELIRERDRAEENDKLKTAFLHNISHEIRTPMNAIIGFSALLVEPDHDEESRTYFTRVISDSCNQLLEVVSDIIEISNIEAGILSYKKETFNIIAQMNELKQQYSEKARDKKLEFRYQIGIPEEAATVETDLAKFMKIMTSLLNNAFKFTSSGRIEYGCTLNDDMFQFYISDTGIGIQRSEQEKIFERFYQVEHTTSRTYEGTGLGLSISKAYTGFLGGKLWLESESGKGSVFHFTIPRQKLAVATHEMVGRKEIHPSAEGTEKIVLIAEDDDNSFKFLEKTFSLSLPTWKVLRARNGKEAIELCAGHPQPAIVLMDIKMPVMNGYDATMEIKRQWPEIKVIAQTAYAFERDLEKFFEAGCDDYISKPIKKEMLLTMLGKYS